MHLYRVKRNGAPYIVKKRRRPAGMSVYDWFMANVDKGDGSGCWIWQMAISHGTYGAFYDADKNKTIRAHHFLVPPLPSREEAGGVKMEYDHLCRNVRCVRPEHLEMVTAAENRRRERQPVTR